MRLGLGDMQMKKRWIALASVLLGATTAAAAVQHAAGVAYCMYCTTDAEFAAAGAGESGAAKDRPSVTLVVNPDTAEARRVTLNRSADGQMQVSMTSSLSAAEVARLTGRDVRADIFVPACTGVTRVSPSPAARKVTPSEKVEPKIERGTLVELADGVYGIVLCQSPLFASYSSVDQAALSTALHAAQLRWQVSTFKGAIGTYGQVQSGSDTHLVPTPTAHEVCAIFNNGDSACYRMAGATASSGGRNAGPASDSSGMAIVNRGSSVEYGAPGGKGRAGENWLVCDEKGGQVSGCHTAIR